jgi:hypothetical protein
MRAIGANIQTGINEEVVSFRFIPEGTYSMGRPMGLWRRFEFF